MRRCWRVLDVAWCLWPLALGLALWILLCDVLDARPAACSCGAPATCSQPAGDVCRRQPPADQFQPLRNWISFQAPPTLSGHHERHNERQFTPRLCSSDQHGHHAAACCRCDRYQRGLDGATEGGRSPGSGALPAPCPAGAGWDGLRLSGLLTGRAGGGGEVDPSGAGSRRGVPRPIPPGGGRCAAGQRSLHRAGGGCGG